MKETLSLSNFPTSLKDALKEKAEQEHRSLTAQIIFFLEQCVKNNINSK